mmetsp:Transcript_107093/g.345755  ORF Transcript_107093/g.345755 Transcript_107093/m.345755 type:complete len:103 (-) Transcript_107093:13-321(-)
MCGSSGCLWCCGTRHQRRRRPEDRNNKHDHLALPLLAMNWAFASFRFGINDIEGQTTARMDSTSENFAKHTPREVCVLIGGVLLAFSVLISGGMSVAALWHS